MTEDRRRKTKLNISITSSSCGHMDFGFTFFQFHFASSRMIHLLRDFLFKILFITSILIIINTASVYLTSTVFGSASLEATVSHTDTHSHYSLECSVHSTLKLPFERFLFFSKFRYTAAVFFVPFFSIVEPLLASLSSTSFALFFMFIDEKCSHKQIVVASYATQCHIHWSALPSIEPLCCRCMLYTRDEEESERDEA